MATGNFKELLAEAEDTELNIFGLSEDFTLEQLRSLSEHTRSSCLMVMDSGHESALA